MKNTILSKKDARLIEKLILKFGRIVSIEQLIEVFKKEYSINSAHNRIQFLYKAGWFVRIKRGLYLIIDNLSSRSMNDISLFLISKAINDKSYISLYSALNYYHMFDQYTVNVNVINYNISKKYKFENNVIQFIKIAKKYYFGFTQERIEGQLVNIATKEKALIDCLYIDTSFFTANLVYEKIVEYKDEIDFNRLEEIALQYGASIQRKIGFLLDQINVDANRLLKSVKEKKGFSRFTNESTIFNAKWRLYYDDRIIK